MRSSGRFPAFLVVGAVLTCCCGCGGSPRTLAPPPKGVAIPYSGALERWTTTHHVYEDFETRVIVHATYFAPEFIGAYVQEYERVYHPLAAELEALAERLRHRKVRQECFFTALFTGERDWNDLSQPGSIWRVYLENDRGERQKATSIKAVKKADAAYRHFFPFFETFFDGYLVCFDSYPAPSPGDTGLPRPMLDGTVRHFTLALRSPVAKIQLRWEL